MQLSTLKGKIGMSEGNNMLVPPPPSPWSSIFIKKFVYILIKWQFSSNEVVPNIIIIVINKQYLYNYLDFSGCERENERKKPYAIIYLKRSYCTAIFFNYSVHTKRVVFNKLKLYFNTYIYNFFSYYWNCHTSVKPGSGWYMNWVYK